MKKKIDKILTTSIREISKLKGGLVKVNELELMLYTIRERIREEFEKNNIN